MSRRRRRKLAAPFVVTTALGACGGAQPSGPTQTANPPPPEEPETYDHNGDRLDGDRPPVIANPPPPGSLPDPPADGKGEVTRRDDGTCWYFEAIECPPEATCNPPPPMQVKCPTE